ncbi:autoinducer 2 ABC transporter substrate-binding protein [Aquibacillus koreensis]|uniref:Autoinducer 2 ABC transporter substrate-binding protein n=1 Tax=Aquibacillus koreensis TaxID=279446 RepID=A0A9X3WLZ7_9BACI|nr:autoinducer 2 ABC transporter substrate-binding protein [Aquibacillus koreensis]MCT2534734.1 autoinducer 2 ABC transporter substrate-binding protein [Aquibacillus koreensis]MDC3419656.1 autoinducer 2 ABC transporter substrate-binding protein [Aquibacillus koreensis]
MKKSFLRVLALLTLVLGLVACSNQGGATETPSEGDTGGDAASTSKSFFINPKSIGPAYWAAAEKGVKQAGEDLGVEVVFNAPSTTDSAQQINMIQDMLTRQVNGVGVAPNDPEAVAPVFSNALSQDVQVVTWDSDAPDTDRKYYIGAATDAELGEQFAEMIANQIGGSGKVAFMVASLSAQNQTAKVDAATAYLEANHPDVEVVTTVSSDDDQQKAYENAQNLISTYPDLKGLVGFAGAEAPAAAQAVEEAVNAGNIEQGKIKIAGFAVPSLVKEYLENGTIEEMVTWDPSKLGYTTVYTLNLLTDGEDVEDGMEIPNVGSIKVNGDIILTGTDVLTKDNVADFGF